MQSNSYTETFSTKDIDMGEVMRRAALEAPKITWLNGRTPEIMIAHCIMGQCAEQNAIQNCGFTNNPNEYMDVYDPMMEEVEFKTSTTEQGIRNSIGKIMYLRYDKGHHIADKAISYLCDNFPGLKWKEPGFIVNDWEANFTFYRKYLANDEKELYENCVLSREFML